MECQKVAESVVRFAYTEGVEVLVHIQDFFDGVAHGGDDAIDDMHHAVGGHLVTVDNPGTVHRHYLLWMDWFYWSVWGHRIGR